MKGNNRCTSPGKIGMAVSQQNRRSILSLLDSPQANSAEAYIQFVPGLFGEDGDISDETIANFQRDYIEAFANFIVRVHSAIPQRN